MEHKDYGEKTIGCVAILGMQMPRDDFRSALLMLISDLDKLQRSHNRFRQCR